MKKLMTKEEVNAMHHVSYKMVTYETINDKINRVYKTYKSKVYGGFDQWYPSGKATIVKVWNTDYNKMIEIKAEDIIEVID